MADYTFFTNPMSRGQIVRWALHEVGADYEQVLIDWSAKPAAFLAAPLTKVPALEPDRHAPEAFTIRRTEVYFHLPNGMGRAKVPDYVGRALKAPMTVRNWRTVTTLLEMAHE